MLAPWKRFAIWIGRVAGAALVVGSIGTGCSDDEQLPGTAFNPGTTPNSPLTGPCSAGAEHDCSITLGNHEGVLTCYHGTQHCVEGTWSECGDGTISHQPAPDQSEDGKTRMQALSMPAACTTNPCDPYCQVFREQPDAAIRGDGGTGFDWTGGVITDYPPTLLRTGMNQPCRTGSDCQFNSYCNNVSTATRCEHNKCQTGSLLTSSCDPCVAQVCAANSTCCAGPCKAGEVPSADGTRCYFVETTNVSWAEARTRCRNRGTGWDLASIADQAEAQYVGSITANDFTWIGLNELGGTWQWANGEAASYIMWASDQPTNTAGEDCARIKLDGTYTDLVCSEEHDSLCEGGAEPASTCAHDPCVTGTPLKSKCDTCVDQVCANRPSCCATTWDSTCVGLVTTLCGRACGCRADELRSGDSCYYHDTSSRSWQSAQSSCRARGTGWDLASIGTSTENDYLDGLSTASVWIGYNDRVTENTWGWSSGQPVTFDKWSSNEPNNWGGNEDCVEMLSDGVWNDFDCNSTRPSFCEGPVSTPRSWSQSCVDLVQSVCDVTCGDGSPPATDGTCVPWTPGVTDPDCAGIDLGVSAACEGTIPVCNHGTVEAPAGIRLIHLPQGSGQYGRSTPNQTGAVTCTTSEVIPPGKCISVTSCSGLTGTREVMVNPPDDSGTFAVTECSYTDNWALYADGLTCGEPLCAAISATNRPLNMYIVPVISTNQKQEWNSMKAALLNFVGSTASAGTRVAMNFPPQEKYSTPGCDYRCTLASCEQMYIGLGELTAAAAPTDTQEAAIVNAVNRILNNDINGDWSLKTFLEGTINAAKARQAAFANEDFAVVLIVQGPGNMCGSTSASAAMVAQDALNGFGIKTYIVATSDVDIAGLDTVAAAGGTTQATRASSSLDATQTSQIQTALESVRNASSFTCSYSLPTTNAEPVLTTVTITSSAGAASTLTQQPNAAGCGTGYYFDNLNAPTLITLCPDTCTSLKADRGATVEVNVPCIGNYTPTIYRQVYENECLSGTEVQWGFLSFNTTTPGDSSVVFEVKSAASAGELASATAVPLATAAANSSYGSICAMSGPSPCPVDIFNALGGLPAARGQVIELIATVNPTSDSRRSAQLNSWQVTYSCPPSE